MAKRYSYGWFIRQFENTKETAQQFITSIDQTLFRQPPAKGRWSIAECYSHLIKYGDLYFENITKAVTESPNTAQISAATFPPRWLAQKIIAFFEPPYRIKVKTMEPMKPVDSPEHNPTVILNEYLHLQDQLIVQLKKARSRQVDLRQAKVRHPIFSLLSMTLSECFLLLEAHQRRHQWQAEQTLRALQDHTS